MANKQDLIAEVAAKTGLTKKKIQKKQLTLLVKQLQNSFQKVKKYNLLVLVLSKLALVQLVKDATLKLAQQSKSMQLLFLHSKLVKH